MFTKKKSFYDQAEEKSKKLVSPGKKKLFSFKILWSK